MFFMEHTLEKKDGVIGIRNLQQKLLIMVNTIPRYRIGGGERQAVVQPGKCMLAHILGLETWYERERQGDCMKQFGK